MRKGIKFNDYFYTIEHYYQWTFPERKYPDWSKFTSTIYEKDIKKWIEKEARVLLKEYDTYKNFELKDDSIVCTFSRLNLNIQKRYTAKISKR